VSHDVGVWIDHKKAVIVSIAAGHVTTRTLESDVGPHPHFSGSQEGGKKYEERHGHELDRFYDDVIRQCGEPDALLLFGPGEASCSSRIVLVAPTHCQSASWRSRARTS
jgi:hypothetical protein